MIMIKEIGGIIAESDEEKPISPEELICQLETQIAEQNAIIENLRRKNKEDELQRESATAMSLVSAGERRKTLSSVNRRTETALDQTRRKITEYSGEFFKTLRDLGVAEGRLHQIEERRAAMALAILDAYQVHVKSTAPLHRALMDSLKFIIKSSGLSIINPQYNSKFDYELHSCNRNNDDPGKDFNGVKIDRCLHCGIKESNELDEEPVIFKKAEVVLQEE